MALLNVEGRQRILDRKRFQAGLVLFYDGAHLSGTTQGPAARLQDIGVGLRFKFQGLPVLRVDYGHGVSDGKNALSIGLNQVF
jgi:hypothetical protein